MAMLWTYQVSCYLWRRYGLIKSPVSMLILWTYQDSCCYDDATYLSRLLLLWWRYVLIKTPVAVAVLRTYQVSCCYGDATYLTRSPVTMSTLHTYQVSCCYIDATDLPKVSCCYGDVTDLSRSPVAMATRCCVVTGQLCAREDASGKEFGISRPLLLWQLAAELLQGNFVCLNRGMVRVIKAFVAMATHWALCCCRATLCAWIGEWLWLSKPLLLWQLTGCCVVAGQCCMREDAAGEGSRLDGQGPRGADRRSSVDSTQVGAMSRPAAQAAPAWGSRWPG